MSKKYADYKRQIKNRRMGKDHVHNVMVMLAKDAAAIYGEPDNWKEYMPKELV